MRPPNRLIEEAFLAPTSEIVRRVEVYESDAKTPWQQQIWDQILIGGNVTLDTGNASRRSLDLELYNYNGLLDPNPDDGGFWYNKVLKVFYGIITHQENHEPQVIIVEEYESLGQALALKRLLSRAGVRTVHYNPQIETLDELDDFDIIISISSSYTRKLALLTEALGAGKSVLTFNTNSTAAQLPFIIGGAGGVVTSPATRYFERDTDVVDPVMNGWSDGWGLATPGTFRNVATLAAGAQSIAAEQDSVFGHGAAVRQALDGSVWIHVSQSRFEPAVFASPDDEDVFVDFLGAAIARLDTFDAVPVWECQIGEFIPDSISSGEETFDNIISCTARDYSAKCEASKLAKATMFTKDQKIEYVVFVLAANCGITKMKLPELNIELGKDTTWERDTDRWSIMQEIAVANAFDLWFDAEGYLRMTPQQDPVATPASLILEGGDRGNLVSRGRKTSSASIFNHVTVIGESSDTSVPLVYGEAINSDPASPSSTVQLGERTKNISSPLITSDLQAQALANTMLTVAALEEFEMNFVSVFFPWIEAGEIVEFSEEENNWGPARYLITSLSLPLDLSPMSGTAKRVVKL